MWQGVVPWLKSVPGGGRVRYLLAVGGALAGLLIAAPAASAAQPPYEPNDSLLTAYGPLRLGQTYTAAMETENDRDYFYFYVNSPSSSQVNLTIKDLGGGGEYAGAEFELQNSHGQDLDSGGGVDRVGDYRTANITLTAGKYYVEVRPTEDYGATYSLTTGGTEGAFGEYAPIGAQCAAATATVTAVEGELTDVEGNLKRAGAHLRRLRYSRNRHARRRAAITYGKAKAAVISEKEAVKSATKAQKPWCEIPQ
jgi:hypothetical protein